MATCSDHIALGLSPHRLYTRKELHQAYIRCARNTHPDHNRNDPIAATQAFQQVSSSYQRLLKQLDTPPVKTCWSDNDGYGSECSGCSAHADDEGIDLEQMRHAYEKLSYKLKSFWESSDEAKLAKRLWTELQKNLKAASANRKQPQSSPHPANKTDGNSSGNSMPPHPCTFTASADSGIEEDDTDMDGMSDCSGLETDIGDDFSDGNTHCSTDKPTTDDNDPVTVVESEDPDIYFVLSLDIEDIYRRVPQKLSFFRVRWNTAHGRYYEEQTALLVPSENRHTTFYSEGHVEPEKHASCGDVHITVVPINTAGLWWVDLRSGLLHRRLSVQPLECGRPKVISVFGTEVFFTVPPVWALVSHEPQLVLIPKMGLYDPGANARAELVVQCVFDSSTNESSEMQTVHGL